MFRMKSMTTGAEDNYICNFKPEVTTVVHVHTEASPNPISHIRLKLIFDNGEVSEEFTVPLDRLDKVKWLEKDIHCRYDTEMSPAKIQRHLEDYVRGELLSAKVEKQHQLNHVGLHDIEGEKAFCTGNGVIRPIVGNEDRVEVVLSPMLYSLDIDTNLSEAEAVAGMLELISLFPDSGRIILSYVLCNILRSAYKDAGKAPNVCVLLYGRTGTQKTTISSLLTQIYNRSKGIISPTRLNASSAAAAVDILMENRDNVVVFDDLFPAASSNIKKQQEETFIEIIRYIGDGTIPARKRGKDVLSEPPECGFLFTGEYLAGEGSDAARLLPVEMTQPDGAQLKFFQDNLLIVSTFYHFYIQWFIDNYNEIVELLKEWLAIYRKVGRVIHDRLQETHFFLNSSYVLLLQYCSSKGFVSESDVNKWHRSFLDLLTFLVQKQDKRVKPNNYNKPLEVDYLARISALYKSNSFTIADSTEVFNDSTHDGVISSGCLCLRGEQLSKYFPSVKLDDMTSSLLAQGALLTGMSNRTKQISSLNCMRFYFIPLEKLQ